jgi:WD40 repeat protein
MFQPKLLYELTFEGSWPMAVTFLDSPRRVAAGNQDGLLYVWELPETPPEPMAKKEGEKKPAAPNVPPKRKLEGHTNQISRLLFDKDRKQIISASFDHTIKYWPIDASPTGKADAVLDGERRQNEFKRTKKEEVLKAPGVEVDVYAPSKTLEGHADWIQTLGASGDFSRLISGDSVAQVIVWDTAKGEPISKFKGYDWNWIVAARLDGKGETAAVAEFRYKRDDFDVPTAAFKTWNVADGSEKLDILKVQFPKLKPGDTTYGGGQMWKKFIADGLVALAFSPDGKLIAAGQGGETDTGKAHILETDTGKLVRDISGHQYGMTDLCFSKDGKLLFTAGRDTCVRITQVEDGKEVGVLGAPRGGQFKDWISAIALSPEETHLAAADIGGMVAVWELNRSS